MKPLITLLLVITFPFFAFAEDFFIEDYHVKVEVMPDGSLDITERIVVNFTAQKRGIIRNIPTQYHISYVPDSLKSLRAEPSSTYYLKIYDLEVLDYEFKETQNYSNLQIRIGSANKFITGKHEYIIKYKVAGVVNPFSTHDEITWNIIGNEWNVEIQNVDFEISFNKNYKISEKDIKLVSGIKGEINSDINYSIKNNTIIGNSTKTLNPKEGISIALRFPKKYLEAQYQIKKVKTSAKINKNGSCNFTELIEVDFNNYQNGFIYKIPRSYNSKNGKRQNIYIKENQKISSTLLAVKEHGAYYQLHLGGYSDGYLLEGKKQFEINYQTWGNIFQQDKETYFVWNFFSQNLQNSIDSFSLKVELPIKNKLSKENIENISLKLKQNLQFKENKLQTKGVNTNGNEQIILKLPLKAVEKIPSTEIIKSADKLYITKIDVTIKIDENKEVHVQEKIECNFLSSFEKNTFLPFSYDINTTIHNTDYQHYPNKTPLTSRTSFFETTYNPFYYNFKFDSLTHIQKYNYLFDIKWLATEEKQTSANLNIAYSVYDVTNFTDSGVVVSIPILTKTTEPVVETNCIIELSKTLKKEEVSCRVIFGYNQYKTVPFSIENNKIIIKLGLINAKNSPFALWVKLPKSYISTYSFSKEIDLFLHNNIGLLFPIGLFLVLLIIWFFVGNNKKQTLVVQYQAPEGITPAEAGFLWDNKLHKRDMTALFYYWAAKSHIKIINNDSQLSFKLLKNLPKSAKQFEKTIFNKVFKGKKIGETVTTSTLKGSFAKTMKKAFRQMKTYSKTKKFYTPGTLGFGRFLVLLSFFMWPIVALIFYVDLSLSQGVISSLAFTFTLFFFGKTMPKRAHFGNKIYNKLLGFKEFIETAEKERLKILVTENSDYFGETIAFAIIMGLGKQWADKFEDLLISSPEWYEGNETKFSSTQFTTNILKSMYQVESSLNYVTPTSSSYSSSSSSSSWSSSSSFSSSSSGSSGFSSGSSFSSGSGFGGGGGSSW